jgi:hypothetical protein
MTGRGSSFQRHPRDAWIYMSIYWLLGAMIGQHYGYWAKMTSETTNTRNPASRFLNLCRVIVFTITVLCQRNFNRRHCSYCRKRNVTAISVFSMMNGLFETILFLFAYDLGRQNLAHRLRLSRPSAVCMGFMSCCIYNGLIHALFWMPYGFPRHVSKTAPPFHRHGLPLLIGITIAWLSLYEWYDDVVSVFLFHTLLDFMASWTICLPGIYQ